MTQKRYANLLPWRQGDRAKAPFIALCMFHLFIHKLFLHLSKLNKNKSYFVRAHKLKSQNCSSSLTPNCITQCKKLEQFPGIFCFKAFFLNIGLFGECWQCTFFRLQSVFSLMGSGTHALSPFCERNHSLLTMWCDCLSWQGAKAFIFMKNLDQVFKPFNTKRPV